MWKKALSIAVIGLAVYGGIQAVKDGRAYLQKRKASKSAAPTK